MAVFETWLKSDLKKPLTVKPLAGNLFSADNQGNLIGVEVMDGGSPAALSGGVTGYVIRADGATLPISGTLAVNRASIVLPASAYAVIGHVSIVIKVGTTTVGACTSYVYQTTTDTIVDPGRVIPSIEELLAQIDACIAATAAATAAASSANTAAANANEKATLANTAAGTANASATAANAATAAANTAAGKIDNMTVAATTSPEGSQASVTITEVNGHKHVAFGIPKGDKGKDFHIAFTFVSIAAMEAYSGDIELFDYAMIDTGNVQDADTGKLYCYEQDEEWHYIGDLSGAQGIKGETGTGIDHVTLNADYTLTIYYDDGTSDTTPSIRGATGITPAISIGSVTTLTPNQQAYVELDQTSTPEAPVFNFGIPKGDTGSAENVYGSTLPMSPQDSTKVDVAINSKASKVSNATNGNFAGLDANGNLTDSGKKPSDILTQAAVVDLIYPVGSIYMSVASTSPATLFDGTTWEQLKDKFLLGAGDTYTAGDTGGNASHTLTTSEMPSHNHTFTGSAVDTGNQSAGHTHEYTDYYATTTGGTAISVAQLASHSHNRVASKLGTMDWEYGPYDPKQSYRSDGTTSNTGSGNTHTHSGANTHTSRTSDGISANHTHSVTASGTIGNSGDGTAFSIMPPYLAVYMWKRTA